MGKKPHPPFLPVVSHDTTEDDIRMFNRKVIFDSLDNVHGEVLYIPVPASYEERNKKKVLEERETSSHFYAIKNFQRKANYRGRKVEVRI